MAWRRAFGAAAIAAITLVVSCESTFQSTKELSRTDGKARILLMPPDIVLGEVTAGGIVEPNAQWTVKASSYVNASLRDFLGERRLQIVDYVAPPADSEAAEIHSHLIKLHALVGRSIIRYETGMTGKLPTKEDRFDWTLGPDVRRLREAFNADYALFVEVQDTYTSGGRAVALVIASVLFQRPVFGSGQQLGIASLIDLKTGAVVWFNRLDRIEGDLRAPDPARKSVLSLMNGFPA
jgi:hypothetical protein